MIEKEFDFNRSNNDLATIDNKINTIVENYEPLTEMMAPKESYSYFE